VRCSRKATFHHKGKLQAYFRAGLNVFKYDYVDFKQHFCLYYQVAATDMKELCKKQTTHQAVAYLRFTVPGDKLSLGLPPSPFVAASIKETLQSDALLQLYNSKEKVFLPLLLKMYRLYCQKGDEI